jgi:hypothetical protein
MEQKGNFDGESDRYISVPSYENKRERRNV